MVGFLSQLFMIYRCAVPIIHYENVYCVNGSYNTWFVQAPPILRHTPNDSTLCFHWARKPIDFSLGLSTSNQTSKHDFQVPGLRLAAIKVVCGTDSGDVRIAAEWRVSLRSSGLRGLRNQYWDLELCDVRFVLRSHHSKQLCSSLRIDVDQLTWFSLYRLRFSWLLSFIDYWFHIYSFG